MATRTWAPLLTRTSTASSLSRIPVGAGRLMRRGFAHRSLPRLGHNLEDHYDMAEFVCKIHNPLGEYFIWFWLFVMAGAAFGPMMHSNYYFTGRFLPKDQGNTQLCDESW